MTKVNKSALDNTQTTTILVDEEIGDEVASKCSLEDPKIECFTLDDCDLDLDRLVMQDGVLHDSSLEDPKMEHFSPDRDDLDLDRLLDHANTFSEPSLEDPSGECFDQLNMIWIMTSSSRKLWGLESQVWRILWKRALLNLSLIWTLTWYMSKLRPYWIPLLRYILRMEKKKRRSSLSPRQFQIGPMTRK
jgi:hypothetical protein